MYDLIFALLMAGGLSLALALAYMLFCLALFFLYKMDGGRLGLISYFKKL